MKEGGDFRTRAQTGASLGVFRIWEGLTHTIWFNGDWGEAMYQKPAAFDGRVLFKDGILACITCRPLCEEQS